jgi:hypothetical protein
VPSVENSDQFRLVLDESSFDFRNLPEPEIEGILDRFNDNLQNLRSQHGHSVACPPMWEYVECLDECQLYQLLSREHPSSIDRDTLLLTYTTLSRCPEWDPPAGIPTSVGVDGAEPAMALSAAYALTYALARRGTACLTVRDTGRQGFRIVDSERGSAQVYYFSTPAQLPQFWRYLFAFEDVAEQHFFTLGALAFPRVILHPDLSFARFDGAYRDVRDRVVTALSALSDDFADLYQLHLGLPHLIQAAMGQRHVDLSPESPKTRGSAKLMRLREKEYDGRRFTCEWHAKIERHRNRIHFSTPADELDGKILIGFFVDHLAT